LGTVEDHKELAAGVERQIAEGQTEMAKAAENRDAARLRRERLERGEDVPGGLSRELTWKDMIKIIGGESDARHCMLVHKLFEAGAEQEYYDEMERRRPSTKAAARAVLRRLLRRPQSGEPAR
jgi:hypothetical protein